MQQQHHKGFTLIEIVVALAVFAIVGTMAFGGLNAILKQQGALTERSDQIKELQIALKYLERDASQIVSRSVRDQFGDIQPAFSAPPFADNESSFVTFTYSGLRNPAGLTRSSLQRISYEISENQLIRHTWTRLDGIINEESRDSIILEDIEDVEWLFLNDGNTWVEQWPPINVQQSNTLLPRALSISFTHAAWGEITRIFPLPQ